MTELLHITPDLPAIRQAFADAGYTDAALLELFGPVTLPKANSPDLPYFLHLTREPKPLHVLARLFLLGLPAPAAHLDPRFLEAAVRCGLLERRGDTVCAPVRVYAYGDLLGAADWSGSGENEVMGLTTSTATLAHSLIQRPARATLDLGTGSGLLAFLCAPHSAEVVATDLSARAVQFTAFNAALNGLGNITVQAGDRFEPVRGRSFDHIVANPPLAISPRMRSRYRDSGVEGDGFCRELVRAAPEYLSDGGIFQCLCDWIQPADWQDRLAQWFAGSGCDAWVMRIETKSAAEYTRIWMHDEDRGRAEVFDDWIAYYERAGIPEIASGLILLRNRSGKNWVRIEDAPPCSGDFGDSIELGFALRDWLDAAGDEDLLSEPLLLNPKARLDQHLEPAEGTLRVTAAEIRLLDGLRYSGNVDRLALRMFAGCNGKRPLRELIAQLAADVGAPAERIAPECLGLIRRVIERGYVLPQRVAALTNGGSSNP